MAHRRFSPMCNRYARNKNFPVESYREYEWDGETFLMVYVAVFYCRWMDAYAFGGAPHHAGIVRLIHTLPSPWSEWVTRAAEPFTWYSSPEYKPRGDLVGLLKVLLPAMAVASDGPPPNPPPPILPPGQARLHKYCYDEEPHVSPTPKRVKLGMRTSAPPRIDREVERMLATVPPPLSAEEENEEEEPLEEERDPNRESVGETEEEEKEEEKFRDDVVERIVLFSPCFETILCFLDYLPLLFHVLFLLFFFFHCD